MGKSEEPPTAPPGNPVNPVQKTAEPIRKPVNPAQNLASPLFIAHRGASTVAPENTAAAIREAVRAGARVIEFDVRTTRDGTLRLFHDKDLERIASDPRAFEELSEEEAAALDVGAWFGEGDFAGERAITLAEAIRLCLEGGAVPLIERKTGSAAQYAEALREEKVLDQVIVQAFDWEFLAELHELLPTLLLGALGSEELDADRWKALEKLQPAWVGWKHSDFSPGHLERLHALGSRVALWTVNDAAEVERFFGEGVDAIITDRIGEMREVFEDGDGEED